MQPSPLLKNVAVSTIRLRADSHAKETLKSRMAKLPPDVVLGWAVLFSELDVSLSSLEGLDDRGGAMLAGLRARIHEVQADAGAELIAWRNLVKRAAPEPDRLAQAQRVVLEAAPRQGRVLLARLSEYLGELVEWKERPVVLGGESSLEALLASSRSLAKVAFEVGL